MINVNLGLAFLAGLASFLSPCVFSMVPVYIGYLGGRTASQSLQDDSRQKIKALLHGLAFVAGFSLVFILLGVTATVFGSILFNIRFWLAKIGGVVIVLFGLHMTGLIKIPWLYYDLRRQHNMSGNSNILSSFLLGVFFSAGWSPCVGPVLGAILTLAFNEASILPSVLLLTAYSCGLAAPFLLAALGIGSLMDAINKRKKLLHYVEIGMGVVLIGVGVLLFLGKFDIISQYGPFIDFGL